MTEELVSMLVAGILEDRLGRGLDGIVVSSFRYSRRSRMPSFVEVGMDCALVSKGSDPVFLASSSASGRRDREDTLRDEAAVSLVRKVASMDLKEVLP